MLINEHQNLFRMHAFEICSNDRNEFDNEITEISLKHFRDNPLFSLLPIPEESLKVFWKISQKKGPTSLVAKKDGRIIGYRSGAVLSYGDFKKVNFLFFAFSQFFTYESYLL